MVWVPACSQEIAKEEKPLQLEAGNSFVNKLVVSDPEIFFGGVKNSGYSGNFTLMESANLSTQNHLD
jgi:succinate-semialdehyde dehydrogenase/glutarate-semialdehyde dehydrogenase